MVKKKQKGRYSMKTVKVELEVDDLIYEFYQKMGQQAGHPVERVMYDALFKLAGELSLNATQKKEGGSGR